MRSAVKAILAAWPGVLLAEDPPASPAPSPGPNPFVLILILAIVMYFLVIRPQRREEKSKKAMLAKLKKNDHVVTSSGILGVVANVTDDEVILKVDESKDVRIRMSRSAIARVLNPDPESFAKS